MSNINYDKYDQFNNLFLCDKEVIKYILKKCKKYMTELNSNSSVLINSGAVYDESSFLIFFKLFLSLSMWKLVKNEFNYLKYYQYNQVYKKKIIETDELFSQLKSEYKELLKKAKEYLITLDIKDEIVMDIFLTNMIKNGFLSISNEYVYKKLKKERRIIDIADARGTRVMSGFGVCRHIVSLILDLNNELNIESKYLASLLNIDEKTNKIMKNKENPSKVLYNHCVVNLKTDKGDVIFDPTNDLILELVDEYKNFFAKEKYMIQYDFFCEEKYLHSYDQTLDALENTFNNLAGLMLIDKIEICSNEEKIIKRKADFKELFSLNNHANNIFYKEYKNLFDFKKDNLKLIKSISEKEKIISGY